MPDPVCYETPRSREWRMEAATASMVRTWVVLHTDDQGEVRDLLLANNPEQFLGFSRKSLDVKSLGAPDCWIADVLYAASARPDGLTPDQLSFKISAQSVHVNQSLQTVYALTADDETFGGDELEVDQADGTKVVDGSGAQVPDGADVGKIFAVTGGDGWTVGDYAVTAVDAGVSWTLDKSPADPGAKGGEWHWIGSAPYCSGAVGVTLDDVQGCDIFVPKMEFTYSKQRLDVDFDYIRALRGLVGKTNDDEFAGFAAGELLYLGAEPSSALGTLASGQEFLFWNLAHSFAHEPNREDVEVGPLVIPLKKGWEYVWSLFSPVTAGGKLTRKATGVYVERMYEPGDFSLLELDL